MQTNVEGKVRNTEVPTTRPLLPLFEAVTNSLQAIEDLNIGDGRIDISILREGQKQISDEDRTYSDVIGFRVLDNGIGFTDENFKAFNESETTYKAERGGRGVGRFSWLVAFDHVQVDSTYVDGQKFKRRAFRFVPVGDGIEDLVRKENGAKRNHTTIELNGFRKQYRKQCPKKPETIGAFIVEHFLEFFIRPECPAIYLHDEARSDSLDLCRVFEQEMVSKSQIGEFSVDGIQFTILHVRLSSSHIKEHLLHFCANHRVVKSEKLSKQIPNLLPRLQDEEGREFVYAAYVESKFLDEHASSERTHFNIAQDESELQTTETTWESIRKVAVDKCLEFLSPYTEPVRLRKQDRIREFVNNQAPMYRPIMEMIPADIDAMSADATDEELDLHLYKAYQKIDVELKQQGQELLSSTSVVGSNYEEYRAKLQSYFDRISKMKAADLARYVCHRRALLEFLKQQLKIDDDGRYPKEDRVHNIFFPMGSTSDDLTIEEHNLWLLDERLAYHQFLASDRQLRSIDPLVNDAKSEPDIIVFDKACAFVASQASPFSSITIIEFKRPMRDGYTETDNPFVQVRKYIEEIRSGKARTTEGRDVPVVKDVPFYCFIVCDIDNTLERQAYDFELTKTPDGQGFFGFKRQYGAYFEVVSYTKIVADAQKRNAIFFDKLGLPSQVG